jgi:phosphatidylinositol-3-phosphatase
VAYPQPAVAVWVTGLVVAVLAAVAVTAAIWSAPAHRRGAPALAQPGALCGQTPVVRPVVRHVIVVMLENRSYSQVVGSPAAPYQAKLASACGSATEAFGATHGSAPNYLAASAGQYPPSSLHGCNYSACASGENNIYQQLDGAGLSWKAYEESMPSACDKSSAWPYKIGHNPAIFYTGISSAECRADDVPVADLTARAGAFYDALHSGTLPAVAWVTPNRNNDGEKPCPASCALRSADTWLRGFLMLVSAAPAYQNGSILVLVPYDEGRGPDNKFGENCANETADLAGLQPSCHLPLFAVWQYGKPGNVGTFFTLYSLTRTIEDMFGLACLAHACDHATASLAGSGFGF